MLFNEKCWFMMTWQTLKAILNHVDNRDITKNTTLSIFFTKTCTIKLLTRKKADRKWQKIRILKFEEIF